MFTQLFSVSINITHLFIVVGSPSDLKAPLSIKGLFSDVSTQRQQVLERQRLVRHGVVFEQSCREVSFLIFQHDCHGK